MALALALIWGLFLFGILNHKADWRLLLLMLTGIGLAIWSLSVLTGCWTVSAMRQGYLFRYLKDQWAALLQTGYYDGLLYWLTAWLVLVCTLLSIWDRVCSVIRVQTEARTLKLKNEMAMESYRILKEKMREGAAVCHAFAHHLTALNAMYEGRNFDGIGRFLTELKGQNQQTSQVQFTQHFAINAMLPPKLSILEENLCTLFMNLLDNALEAAGQAEKGNRFIHLRSTKPESEAHGFGLTLMETIAQKYKSILDVSYTETVFTIQTALKLPTETEN